MPPSLHDRPWPRNDSSMGENRSMGLIYADLSMSLDGFIAGPNVSIANGLGDGGERLHDWMFAGRSEAEATASQIEKFATTGAYVVGRTMLDVGIGPWGDEPTFHGPVF